MIRARWHRSDPGHGRETDEISIDPGEISGLIRLPDWLRVIGLSSWLTAGVIILLVGVVWLLSLADAIVMPLITAGIVASVASPLVRLLNARGVPRAVGAAMVLILIVVSGLAMTVLVIGGVAGEAGNIATHLSGAEAKIAEGLKDLGVDPNQAKQSAHDAGTSSSDTVKALLNGLGSAITGLAGLFFFLALTALSLFFLLKDGPLIRAWAERALPIPDQVAESVTKRVVQSMRGYFLGVTIVAAYSAAVVGVGALIIGVSNVPTIIIVTFLGGYIPYLGAWAAGIFAFLIALGDGGTSEAIWMGIVVLLANGMLQQLVQPFAYGAALGIHPLAVLVVTIAGGALFGAVGLVLAAPLTSAVVRITADIAKAKAADRDGDEPAAGAEPQAGPDPAPA